MTAPTGPGHPQRRRFLKTVGAAAIAVGSLPVRAAAAMAQSGRPPGRARLGLDTFSLGAQNWTPMQMLAFGAKWNLDVMQFSEIRFLGSPDWRVALDPANLKAIRARADELGIRLEVGMRSFCPTSGSFDKTAGTGEEQLGRMIDAATILGSPLVRCFQGTQADRSSNIDHHIDESIKVLLKVRSKAMDAGVKISVENHAGDLQARELKRLIEESGKEFVGATIDSGNAMWAIEDPHLTLETLAPYVLTSHMRDSYVWNSAQGTAVQWSRMGDGNIGMEDYLRKFVAQCPGKTVNLEVIVQGSPRLFNYRDPQAWQIFQTTPAWEFARFLARCEAGSPRPLPAAAQGQGPGGAGGGRGGRGGAPNPEAQRIALEHVEASIAWTRGVIARI